MQYREFEVTLPDKTAKLGILGETHIYTPKESNCAGEIVSQFDSIAIEGSDRFTRVRLALLPFMPAVIALAHGSNRTSRTAKDIAEDQKKKIVRLEPNMGESFSNKQLLALTAIGLMTIPFTPLIYAYSKYRGEDAIKSLSISEKKSSEPSYLERFVKFAIESNIAERDRKMAERTRELVLTGAGNVLHVSGQAHTDGVIANLLASQDANFQLHKRATSVIDPACEFTPRLSHPVPAVIA